MEKMNKIVAIIISVTILSFSIWFMVNDKKEFSDNEFRYLQKFPTFTFENLKCVTPSLAIIIKPLVLKSSLFTK